MELGVQRSHMMAMIGQGQGYSGVLHVHCYAACVSQRRHVRRCARTVQKPHCPPSLSPQGTCLGPNRPASIVVGIVGHQHGTHGDLGRQVCDAQRACGGRSGELGGRLWQMCNAQHGWQDLSRSSGIDKGCDDGGCSRVVHQS